MSSSDIIPSFSFQDMKKYATRCLQRRISVLMFGHPGVGKSSLAKEVAQELKLPLIDIRLSQRDPSELAGIQMPDKDGGLVVVYPPDWLKQICDAPHLLFLDEISTGVTKLHQAIAYQLLNDRCLGAFKFHPDTIVMAASNLPEDNAIVAPLSDALIDRVARAILDVDAENWLDWAAAQTPAISPDIRAWIAWKGNSALYRRYDMAMATPRSWARASLLEQPLGKEKPLKDSDRRKVIGMCIGIPMATEYYQFLSVYRSVDIDGFIEKGMLPGLTRDNPSLTHAFVFALCDRLTTGKKLPVAAKTLHAHLAALFAMKDFTSEFTALFLRQLYHAKPSLYQEVIQSPELKSACSVLSDRLQKMYE